MTTATLTSAPLFAGFAELVARVQRPRRRRSPSPGPAPATATGSACSTTSARLSDAPADVAYRVRV